ncbi:hypothetical protein [Paenibacillus shenyangensis]|uniref:hypothetical protein n=1 Tax=Paenibacillus sp. A9 TaxID=1284352 RepID=UPI00038155A1|nr:hypothetical protein [Paenibacillus sp. A9]
MKTAKMVLSIGMTALLGLPLATAYAESNTSVNQQTSSSPAAAQEIDSAFFQQQKQAVVRDIAGTSTSGSTSAASASQTSEAEQLKNADYTYMTVTGEVYSSKRGYLGAAKRDDEVNNTTSVTQFNPNNTFPVNQINGGTTGAFERRQLDFEGFDSITSDITLPAVSGLGEGEQPWVYYGFDSERGPAIEGGYAYQTGTHRWLPYIRSNGFYYGDSAVQKYDGNQIKSVKFYLAKTVSTDTYYNAYFVVDNSQILIAPTKWTDSDTDSTSVKRVTSIAKKAFDGNNIQGTTMNQRYENVQVSRFNEEQAYPWSQYTEYTEQRNGKWYGTLDNSPVYVHRNWINSSIFKSNN